jgi:hypothetical protein
MKTLKQFLQEASLQGNPGTPDEYLKGVERRAMQDVQGTEQRLGREMGQFMQFVGQVQQMQTPQVKAQLEKLAEDIIMKEYGSILTQTKLDIKFAKENEIKQMMEDVPMETPKQQKEISDKGTIAKIQARKIGNAIMQGEAKNAKRMLALPETMDGMVKIFGPANAAKMVDLLKKITDIASALDWRIPMEVQKQMWERDKGGFSGSVKVDFTPVKTDEQTAEELIKSLESGDIETQEIEDTLNEMEPTIIAIGTDFAMLLHEAIKGIYKLIGTASIPDDEEEAGKVIANTGTLSDELEDLRYGPYLAADLRDFLNRFTNTSSVENIREHVFGKLMVLAKEETQAFLVLMKEIFTEDAGAINKMKSIVSEIEQEIKDWERGQFDEEVPDFGTDPAQNEPTDPSQLSKREIQALIDAALDAGDYAEVGKLAKYLD